MSLYLYFFLPVATLLLVYVRLYLDLNSLMDKTATSWNDFKELIIERNTIALSLLKLAENRIPQGIAVSDNVRKYGKLSAISNTTGERAENAELFRKNLAEFLEISQKSPEIPNDPNFVKVCRELRDVEYRIDTTALKYNNFAFRLNQKIANPITGILTGILKVTEKPYFAVVHSKTPVDQGSKSNTRVRDLADAFILAMDKNSFVTCSCGLDIRIPPDFKHKKVFCQLCETSHDIPDQQLRAIEALIGKTPSFGNSESPEEVGQTVKKEARGWGVLTCSCGNIAQLSPQFEAPHVRCSSCGNTISPKPRQGQSI